MENGFSIILPLIFFFIIDLMVLIDCLKYREELKTKNVFKNIAFAVTLQQLCSVIVYLYYFHMLSLPVPVMYVIHAVMVISMTIASYEWLMYLCILITNGVSLPFRAKVGCYIPIIVIIICTVSTYWTHWLFYFDANGIYHAGTYSLLQFACPYFYIIPAFFSFLIFGRKNTVPIIANIIKNFLIFILAEVVGTILQLFVCQGGYTMIGLSFGFILMYLELYVEEINENKRMKTVHSLNMELRETNDIIRAAGYGIWRFLLDSDGNITGMIGNEKWKDIYGIEDKDISPKDCLLYFLSGLDPQMVSPADFNYSGLDKEYVINVTFPWKHPKKGTIFITISGTKYVTSSGENQITGYAADVTEETLAKQKWEKEILDARKTAEEANRAKTAFLFNMSHDIRTPMNAIIGYTNLIQSHRDDQAKCDEYLKKIQTSSDFLLTLINNVLEMARIESGKSIMDEEPCRIPDVVEEIENVYSELMKDKHIIFTRQCDVNTEYVLCDRVKLNEILLNLVSNAYKYTLEGGEIDLTIKELPCEKNGYTCIRIIVSDTGIGMSKDYLPILFEEFSRERTATEARIQGTGLGMPIVKKLVDLMGGTITVNSELGKGTEFIVTMTYRISTNVQEREGKTSKQNISNFEGKRILVVEDNDLNAEIAIEILKDLGFEAEHAQDGIICIDKLQKNPAYYYDAILMDIQMPNMDGYKATRVIRQMKDLYYYQIPIIAMTANAFEEDKKNALQAGMNAHLSKPINITQLIRTLSSVIK